MFIKASVIQAETRIRGMICRDCKKGSILSVNNFQGGWLKCIRFTSVINHNNLPADLLLTSFVCDNKNA